MEEIPLTQGYVVLVDDEDYERMNAYKWCAKKGNGTFYAMRNSTTLMGGHTTTLMHREILNPIRGIQVDHIDGNGLNNQRRNMRFCSQIENSQNRRPNKTAKSKYKGVVWHKHTGRWNASICVATKDISLGYYYDEKEAAIAYDKAAVTYFGEFARLNQI